MNIAEPTGIMCHFEAMEWINSLMVDLKLTLGGMEPQRPIDAARLEEWDAFSRMLLRCRVPATTARHDTRTLHKHAAAVDWLTRLVVDVAKPLLGYEGEPVTLERLSEFRPFRQDIEGCMTRGDIVY
jgi:hypothetical protein